MAILRMKDRFMWAAAIWLAGGMAFTHAETPGFSAKEYNDSDWILDGTTGYQSKTLSLGQIGRLTLDGLTLNLPVASTDKVEGTSVPSRVHFKGRSQQQIDVQREITLDPRRNALRILDVLSNLSDTDREIAVRYETYLSERGGVQFNGTMNEKGVSVEYGQPIPADSQGAIIFAESQEHSALPMFLWAQTGAAWTVKQTEVSSTLRVTFGGTLPKKGKVALIHWVATTGLNKGEKLEKSFDKFWKKDRLVNPMIPDEVIPLIVNYKPEALKGSAPEAPAEGQEALLALDAHCQKLGLQRGSQDVLWMGKDSSMTGLVSAESVILRSGDKETNIPWDMVAAIRGGAGKGRTHRLFLRDGSVRTGMVTLVKGTLAGELGTLNLDTASLDFLLLRKDAKDGTLPGEAKWFVDTAAGERRWLKQPSGSSMILVTANAHLPLPLNQVVQIKRRDVPPFQTQVVLEDGTSVEGVLAERDFVVETVEGDKLTLAHAEVERCGRAAVAVGEAETVIPTGAHVKLRDQAVLTGGLEMEKVRLKSSDHELEVPVSSISKIEFDPSGENGVTVSLVAGTSVKATLIDEFLVWKHGEQRITIPNSSVMEILLTHKTEPSPAPADPAP